MAGRAPRLWTPEQPEVAEELRQIMAMPGVDPSGPAFAGLLAALRPLLGRLLGTSSSIFLVSGSVAAVRESLIRSLVGERLLHLVTGPDSAAWHKGSVALGREALRIGIPEGQAARAEGVRAALQTAGAVEAVALCHVEAASGVLNPLRELSAVLAGEGQPLLLVDATYSITNTELAFDRDRIDGLVAGSIGFGLPPGLVLVVLSHRALERAEAVEHRGHALDWLRRADLGASEQSLEEPASPPLVMALGAQLRRLELETQAARFERYWRLSALARAFAKETFELGCEDGYGAYGLTCIRVPEGFDLEALHEALRRRGAVLGRGRGSQGARSFRIAHSGDTSLAELERLLDAIGAEAAAIGGLLPPFPERDAQPEEQAVSRPLPMACATTTPSKPAPRRLPIAREDAAPADSAPAPGPNKSLPAGFPPGFELGGPRFVRRPLPSSEVTPEATSEAD